MNLLIPVKMELEKPVSDKVENVICSTQESCGTQELSKLKVNFTESDTLNITWAPRKPKPIQRSKNSCAVARRNLLNEFH